MRYNRNNCTTVEEPGVCENKCVTLFEILLCQHLVALIMLFVARNSDVNGVSATPKIVWNGTSFISHSSGFLLWLQNTDKLLLHSKHETEGCCPLLLARAGVCFPDNQSTLGSVEAGWMLCYVFQRHVSSGGGARAVLSDSCFPLWLCHRETRAGQSSGNTEPAIQEQAGPSSRVVPLLNAEPAVNRGEREAPVDSYNRPLKPTCAFPLPVRGHQGSTL